MKASELKSQYDYVEPTREESLKKKAEHEGFKTVLAYVVSRTLYFKSQSKDCSGIYLVKENRYQNFDGYIFGSSFGYIQINKEGLDELRELGYIIREYNGFWSFCGGYYLTVNFM